ncbi:MAG: hypothetical protein OEZ06_02420 [Myxococcales bacterium]|nr:hypothetical protein [Myxococcales bacterium]
MASELPKDPTPPGVYLLTEAALRSASVGAQALCAELESVGRFRVGAHGLLSSQASRDGFRLWMEGILTSRPPSGCDEADVVLEAFIDGGPEAVARLDGFFAAIVVEPGLERAHFIGDALSTRPHYVYQRGEVVAIAPSPRFFVQCGFSMSLDRLALYQLLRLMHTCSDRSLAAEFRRTRPGTSYGVWVDGRVESRVARRFVQAENASLTLDDLADWIKELVAHSVVGVVEHPKLCERAIELPLTAGMDSRHILGELLERGRPPSKIRHVRIVDAEYQAAKRIADHLGIAMRAPDLQQLDYEKLLLHWARRSAAELHLHQFYLLDILDDVPAGGSVGFDGHLMDWLLGQYQKRVLPKSGDPTYRIWNRTYEAPPLRMLMRDAPELARESHADMYRQVAHFDGAPWFKMMMLDLQHRGTKYTGGAYPIAGDAALYFAPGGHVRSLDFVCGAPFAVGSEKRARLRVMQRDFPELAALPDNKGVPYTDYQTFRKKPLGASSWLRKFLPGLLSAGRIESAPESEHAWMRRRPTLRAMHQRLVDQSLLAQDGELSATALAALWRYSELGGLAGHTFTKLMTAEAGYRLLIKGQSPEQLVAWMLARD